MASMEELEDIRDSADNLVLEVGDLIVDPLTRSVGVLMDFSKTEVHDAYMYPYALGYWRIYWISNDEWEFSYNGESMMEEYGLKMSVAIGIYQIYSAKEGKKI